MNSSTLTPSSVVEFPKKGGGPQRNTIKNAIETMKYCNSRKALVSKELIMLWEPTDEQRQSVKLMVAGGMLPEDIARVIHPLGPISPSTLRRKFKEELRDGKAETNRAVIEKAFEMATSGKHPLITRLWLIANAGWADGYGRGSGMKEPDVETVSKKLQNTAKYMVETMPGRKVVGDKGGF